jgi:MHS family proline/betaine transporter-like MFS transporter
MMIVGGVIMGYIGDKYGRKRALELSIFLMAFPTFAMGCLPSYESVGALSIVLLVLVRCLQGLSVGGQLVSSLVYTLEQNPKRQWGLYGSYVMAAANFGTLLGGIVATSLKSSLSEEQLLSYGWRIPFLSGILVSLCGLYLKFYGDEEIHHGGGEDGEGNGNPLIMAFRKENIRPLISASLAPMLWSGGFYISFVWMATFMDVLIEPPVPNAFLVNSLALFISVCLLFPLAGYLSDKHGRTKIMYIGGISLAVISPFMIIVISKGNAVAAFFAQCAMGISLSLWGAPSKFILLFDNLSFDIISRLVY